MKKTKLTGKQQKFVDEYMKLRNATQSVKNAGYSAKTAAVQGARLLTYANIRAEIDRRSKIIESKNNITVERIEEELAKIAFSNMLDYITVCDDGTALVNLSSLNRDTAAAIQEVTVDSYDEGRGQETRVVKKIKFKLADKKTALDTLAKIRGMLRNELINLNVDLSDLTSEQLQRIRDGEPIEKVLQG